MTRSMTAAALLILCSAANAQVTPVQRYSNIFKEWYSEGFPWNSQTWTYSQMGPYSIPLHNTTAGSAGVSGFLEAQTGTEPPNIWWGIDNVIYFTFQVTTPVLARMHGTLTSANAAPFAAFIELEGPGVDLLIHMPSGLSVPFDQSIPLAPGTYQFVATATSLYSACMHCSNAFTLGFSTCYANCDNSTAVPVLNVADFSCFLTRFAAGDLYANCDMSTTQPALNVADFSCFLQKFAAGCE